MLIDAEKVDIRRHLGVPFSGLSQSGLTMGIRTLFQAGQLEFYMTNLQAYEESVITGRPYGQIRIYGTPIAGQTLTATVNGTPIVYTVTSGDQLSTAPLVSVANNFANAVNLVAIGGVFAAGSAIVTPTVPTVQLPPFSYVTFVSSTITTFTLTSASTGSITAFLYANGSALPFPQTSVVNLDGTVTQLVGYLQFCNYMQSNIAVSSGNMAILSAGENTAVTYRPYEMKQRIQLYDYWREGMGRVLSVGKDAWSFRGNSGSNQGGAAV